MKKITRYAAIGVVSVSLIGAAVCGLGYAAGLRINTTKSIPVGLYKISDKTPEKGDYVIFCPPQRDIFSMAQQRGYIGSGFCPGGYGEMMKRILAAKGDEVAFRDDGVYVNGNLLPYSKPFSVDPGGRNLPALREVYTLGKSELLLMTDRSPSSFDGRYFGAVTTSQIISAVSPVFTW
ncbi:TPA: conjugative transfer signal peptidase TraF [Escherichia coli]|uniref:conjugative transfer signal peptidase TraF n=1 Tax=Cronobacter muytjensii TaxID=413501 RepID=UPI001587F960|nr:conjugative transfer signal peptidase TraF [Cronobacter muytjensii]EAT8674963.1 conjugative transfer signal peptidase TraF [Salmonella enterica]EES5376836.1 conjugative transfer signal peptidase TraF [Escherichia coli]EES5680332.1 conjugative transfer signal peptidase TraF [Escherichia coli]NUW61621.1 conjugative transfer signal peptidase TraF [Cronobacter muytjensii]HDS3454406.1 conjugative transfer signal peptidase TraF [Escherichia coli]